MYDVIETLQSTNLNLNFLTNGLSLLVYILQALALYTVAKRRGINKPWLAWIPFGNSWILGSLSDQYQYVTKRAVKNKRKALLGLEIALSALVAVIVFAAVFIIVQFLFAATGMMMAGWMDAVNSGEFEVILDGLQNVELSEDSAGAVLLMLAVSLPLTGVAIAYEILFWMAMYDLFRSSDPANSTMYLVISLVGNFVVTGLYSVFMMLCKDKDLGMPPRRQEPEVLFVSEQPSQSEEEL